MKPYEKLLAWQACHQLALDIYRVTASWPSDERYGLIGQARRAAFSAAANIAEGSAKLGPREFRRFLDSSLGSLAELSYLLRLTRDLGMLRPEDDERLNGQREQAGKLCWGLYRRVRKVGQLGSGAVGR